MNISPTVETIVRALETPRQRLGVLGGHTFSNLRKRDIRAVDEESYTLNHVAKKMREIILTPEEMERIQAAVEKRIRSLRGRGNLLVWLFMPHTLEKIEKAVEYLETFSSIIAQDQKKETFQKLNFLKILKGSDLPSHLKKLNLRGLSQLEEIDLSFSSIEEITGLNSLTALKKLNLSFCKSLKEVELSSLNQLEELDLRDSSIEKITSLNSLTALKKLNLILCKSLKEVDLSNLNQLEEIDLSHSSITGLSLPKTLKRLRLKYCKLLKELDLSGLNQLEELDSSDSSIKKITGLSSAKTFKRLYLSYCNSLKEFDLSGLNQLEELDLSHSSIEKIMGLNSLTSLKTLILNGCESLKKLDLSGLSQLEEVNLICSSVEKVVGLNSLTAFKKLDLTSCKLLKELDLSGSSQLEVLDLSHSSVEKITGLSFLINLKKIYIDFCNCLQSIDLSNLDSLEEVNCDNCPLLTTIGEAISNCSLLNCRDCPRLINLPQLPFTATVYSGSTGFRSFCVNPEELDKDPLRALLKLGKESLLANQPMPNIVWMNPLTNEPALGIDAGGVRRQLITTLTENLFKEGSQFPFIKEPGGKLLALDDPSQEDTVLAFRTFARLIALCATSSLLMGKHLPLSFFYALRALTDQEIDSVSFDKPLADPLRKKIYTSLLGKESMEVDQEDLKQYPVVFPIAIMAKEMKNIPGFSFALLRNETKRFINSVQGNRVTKESLLNQLQCGNAITGEYFKKYLEDNPAKLTALLELFTGCQTLGEDPIVIRVCTGRDPSYLPSIHTCSQEVEMPFYPDYETFKAKIDASFEALKTFETI